MNVRKSNNWIFRILDGYDRKFCKVLSKIHMFMIVNDISGNFQTSESIINLFFIVSK